MSRNSKLSHEQMAEIFCRDRATCSFTGRSLWVSDFGIDPWRQNDQVDHVKAASKGGEASLENGALVGWVVNHQARATADKVYLYSCGGPTTEFFYNRDEIPADVTGNLVRFSRLDPSDWYLNRAMAQLVSGMLMEACHRQGFKKARRRDYYVKAAWGFLGQWRKEVGKRGVESVERRKLLLPRLAPDQKQLLEIREAATIDGVGRIFDALYPAYDAASEAMDRLMRLEAVEDVAGLKSFLSSGQGKLIPIRIRTRIAASLKRLDQIFQYL